MRNILKTIGIAGLLSLAAGVASAQQFGVQFGGDDRQDRGERRMERRIDRDRDGDRDRDRDRMGSVERRLDIRDEPRVRIIQRDVRERPRYRIVCRTVTKVIRVGNTIIRRPGQECTRRIVSRNVIFR